MGSPAPTRLHIVQLCLLSRWRSATRQPDPKLHSVGGRRLLDAALELAFDGWHAAACGSSMSARAQARAINPLLPPRWRWCPERALLELRTTDNRRACGPMPPDRSVQHYCRVQCTFGCSRVRVLHENEKRENLCHLGLDPTSWPAPPVIRVRSALPASSDMERGLRIWVPKRLF